MKKNRRDFLKSCCSLGTTAVAANLTVGQQPVGGGR